MIIDLDTAAAMIRCKRTSRRDASRSPAAKARDLIRREARRIKARELLTLAFEG
jgi:hypothetical protein